jgi:hypothetical protein
MNRAINRVSAVVLFAFIALGTTGCAGKKASPLENEQQAFDDVRAELLSIVIDPKRAAEAVELVSALEQSFSVTRKDIELRKANLILLNEDYDASRSDFEVQFEHIALDIRTNRNHISAIHRQFAEVLTAEEWAAIDKARSKAMNAAINTIQSL